MIVAYSYLTRVALFHARALQNLVSPEFHRARGTTSVQRDRTLRLIREVKATKMMAVVVGVFFVCWFPFFVLVLKHLWSPSPVHPILAGFSSILFVAILPNLNSALNPLIYMAFTRELRHAFVHLLDKFLKRINCRKSGCKHDKLAERKSRSATGTTMRDPSTTAPCKSLETTAKDS